MGCGIAQMLQQQHELNEKLNEKQLKQLKHTEQKQPEENKPEQEPQIKLEQLKPELEPQIKQEQPELTAEELLINMEKTIGYLTKVDAKFDDPQHDNVGKLEKFKEAIEQLAQIVEDKNNGIGVQPDQLVKRYNRKENAEKRLLAATYKNTPHVNYSCIKRGKVIRITDGDTIVIAVNYYGEICKFRLRMMGFNTAELHEKKTDRSQEVDQSEGAKAERLSLAKDAKTFITELLFEKIVDLEIYTGLKYKNRLRMDINGRLLGKVFINGLDVCEEMISRGLGIAYDGGTKAAPKRETSTHKREKSVPKQERNPRKKNSGKNDNDKLEVSEAIKEGNDDEIEVSEVIKEENEEFEENEKIRKIKDAVGDAQ